MPRESGLTKLLHFERGEKGKLNGSPRRPQTGFRRKIMAGRVNAAEW